jgi:diguanylate cyclase (GGDEF)-like protein
MEKPCSETALDAMTGLKSYLCFTEDFDGYAASAVEKCEDLSLAMVDIDHFMQVNDQYGHAAGDEVIKSLASHLLNNVPPSACVYRYAGDQFAVLLPATEKERAFLMIEKARSTWCVDGAIATQKGSLAVTISFTAGISCCPEDGARMAEIVRKAEGALFRAKASGPDKVCLSREEKMVTKTSHYTYEQLQRLSALSKKEGMGEAILLREALDDLLKKYDY